MLFPFFLRRFLVNFILFFALITVILGVGNVFIKVSMLSSFDAVWFVFVALIPLMSIFAFPIAAGLAVHSTVGSLLVNDELLVVRFFCSAKRSLWGAALFFSFAITLLYVPLTFYWAPQSYWVGKRALLHLAKRQFFQCDAGKFYSPYPGITFFFKQKSIKQNVPYYSSLFLTCNNKPSERYLFTAQQGFFKNNCLHLLRGSVYTIAPDKHYFALFERTEINLSKIFNLEKDLLQGNQARFLSMHDLFKINDKKEASYEFHKRLAQIFWLLLFPLLALMNVLIFGRNKSNLLLGVVFTGMLFLVSYVSMSFAHVIWGRFGAALLLYGVIAGIFAVMLTLYLRKFR